MFGLDDQISCVLTCSASSAQRVKRPSGCTNLHVNNLVQSRRQVLLNSYGVLQNCSHRPGSFSNRGIPSLRYNIADIRRFLLIQVYSRRWPVPKGILGSIATIRILGVFFEGELYNHSIVMAQGF